MNDFQLLLASSSPFRQKILKKLRIPFDCASPDIDESYQQGESPQAYVERLANEKAKALAPEYPNHWIIGSDQTCVLNGQVCGKPKTTERAIEQLTAASGQSINFYTGLSLLNARTGVASSMTEQFQVHFRNLSDAEIRTYVELERPLNCAGSFMVEGLGINLFERLEGRDENSLIGLPLIGLLNLMREAGLSPLALAQ